MAKSAEKIQARELRRAGRSIRSIAQQLKVSKSSASLWCEDIQLTAEQITLLDDKARPARYAAILKGAQANHQRKLDRIAYWEQEAVKDIGIVGKRELFFIGLGLYFGEGSKKEYFQFTNSSPELIKLCIEWLKLLNISTQELNCRVFINEIHRERAEIVQNRWVEITGIPKDNFAPVTFIQSKLKKLYENHDTYLGVLAIRAYKSSELFYRILGLMKVFLYNTKT